MLGALLLVLEPISGYAYTPPDELFGIPVTGTGGNEHAQPTPDIRNFPLSSSSSSSSNSSSSSSRSSSSSSRSSSSSSYSYPYIPNPSNGSPDPNNPNNFHDSAQDPYLGSTIPPPVTNDPNSPYYDPSVVSIRTNGVRSDLSNTGPGEMVAIVILALSAAYTIRRAYKLDKSPI